MPGTGLESSEEESGTLQRTPVSAQEEKGFVHFSSLLGETSLLIEEPQLQRNEYIIIHILFKIKKTKHLRQLLLVHSASGATWYMPTQGADVAVGHELRAA